jgi:hypothetical protein
MELFDLIKNIFESPERYKEASKIDKRKNFFMIQRRFAIAHPLQANALNSLKINQEAAIDVWQKFMRKKYEKTPGWMYIKGTKKAKEDNEKKIKISSSTIQEYAKLYGYQIKAVNDALKLYPEKMAAELQAFEKIEK